MKKVLLLILPAFILFASCQKELTDPTVTGGGSGGSGGTGGSGSTDITGNWKFVSLSAVTQSANQFSLAGTTYKTVTNTDYTTINNTGTVAITGTTMTSTGFSYDVNDTAFALSYENNVLTSSLSSPFTFHLPSYSSATPYKLVGIDSIYFSGQGLDPSTTGGSGAHYSLNGNILKLTTSVVKDTTINAGGILASQHSTATGMTTLQRQ